MKAYDTYESAAADCGVGYQAEELTRVVLEKTMRYRDSLRPAQLVISDLLTASVAAAIGLSRSEGALKCLDFGGAAGAHFFFAKKILGESTQIHWHVVETQNMVSTAGGLSGDGLRFFTSIDEAVRAFAADEKGIDLVFSSGALQYVPKPEDTLTQLICVGARRVFITRTPLSEVNLRRRVAVQHSRLAANGPGPLPSGYTDRTVKYPVTFCCKSDFERIIEKQYVIDLHFWKSVAPTLSTEHRLLCLDSSAEMPRSQRPDPSAHVLVIL